MENEKKVVAAMLTAACLVLVSSAYASAAPVIGGIDIDPRDPWINENIAVRAGCEDNSNGTIQMVYANVSGQGISFTMPMYSLFNDTYSTDILGSYLSGTGSYNVNIGCVNQDGSETSQSRSFTVSRLAGEISSVMDAQQRGVDGTVFAGESFDAFFRLSRDGSPITNTLGIGFDAVLSGQDAPIQYPIIYRNGKGHGLRMMAPTSSGDYLLEVMADYDGKTITNQTWIEVIEPLILEISSIDKQSIRDPESITVKVRASYRGNSLPINENDISITVDDSAAQVQGIAQDGNYYNVQVMPPALPPGSYKLRASFSYGGYSRTAEKSIYYTIPVQGELVQGNNGIQADIEFKDQNDIVTRFYTDSSGIYTGSISPGTYDVTMEHDESMITFEDVILEDEFDDPIRYGFISDKQIPGIKTAAIYSYEVALDYSQAVVEMSYHDRKFSGPEGQIKAYRCDDWNGDRCYSEWEEVSSNIDTVRNTVEVAVSEVSTYALGIREGIYVEVGTDKDTYNLNGKVMIEGFVTDEKQNAISGAFVQARMLGTSQHASGNTSSQGVFDFEFDTPDSEGTFTIEITAEKDPYDPGVGRKSIEIKKSTGLMIDIPSGVKMEVGTAKSVDCAISNTGQLNLDNITISLEGLPDHITATPGQDTISSLGPGSEQMISIDIDSGSSGAGTYPVTIKLDSSQGVTAEKTFALTTEKLVEDGSGSSVDGNQGSAQTADTQPFEMPDFSMVGNFIAQSAPSIGYMFAALVGSFSFAILMRRRRLNRSIRREWISNKLQSVNKEISRSADGTNKSRQKKSSSRKGKGR